MTIKEYIESNLLELTKKQIKIIGQFTYKMFYDDMIIENNERSYPIDKLEVICDSLVVYKF
jgi:hypothetical protein